MQNNGEQWRFWTAVRAEMRATWWGRRRWLWIGLGVACFSILAVLTWAFTDLARRIQPAYMIPFLWLACWPPAWLGSDLLSLRFTANPDPLREWRPAEFLARFVGRLTPLLGVLTVTMTAINLGEGVYDTSPLLSWAEVTAPFLASALCYAALASLVSSLAKRPRRWLITALVVIFGSGLATAFWAWRLGEDSVALIGLFVLLVGIPNLVVGFASGVGLHDFGQETLGLTWHSEYPYFVAAAISFLAVAILAGLWTWWIAARRYRRSRAVQRNE